jgi:hypothetical protein
MIEIAYTAPDYFGVFGACGEIHTLWLIPTREDVLRACWYASQGVAQFDGYEQTLFDLLMAGF